MKLKQYLKPLKNEYGKLVSEVMKSNKMKIL